MTFSQNQPRCILEQGYELLKNTGKSQKWQTAQALSYRFSRLYRHDIANMQTELQLAEFIAQAQADGSTTQADLELLGIDQAPDIHQTISQIIEASMLAAALSQAGNAQAYQNVVRVSACELIEDANLLPYLANEACGDSPTKSGRMVSHGSMLACIMSVLAHQWFKTPGYTPKVKLSSDDNLSLLQFSFLCKSLKDGTTLSSYDLIPIETWDHTSEVMSAIEARISIERVALNLAAFIAAVHQGQISINDEEGEVELYLPILK